MAESSTITREPEISARDVAAITPDDYPAVQQALKRAAATDDPVAKNYALKRAAESIGLLSGHQPFPVEPFSDGAYPAVFLLIRESLEAGAPGVAAGIKDAMARSAALKVVARKLAPAAYGDKRQPHYTHAMAGVEGMCATLHLRDGSLELVFKDEELDLINEEGRDLYVARIKASEVLTLRQWLIDFLPASEAEIRSVEVAPALAETANGLADLYVQRVSEWDDRTSPQDWPEALLITGTELKAELLRFAHEAAALATGSARDDIQCQCVSTFGPNPECGACGGSGCVSTGGARG